MLPLTSKQRLGLAAAAVLGAVPLSLLAQDPGNGPPIINDNNNNSVVFSAIQIVTLNGQVMRLDTTSGELWKFNGELRPANASGSWVRFVRPATNSSSGFLQVQRADTATFLVDAIEGDTWILRNRGSSASWIKVNVVGNSGSNGTTSTFNGSNPSTPGMGGG